MCCFLNHYSLHSPPITFKYLPIYDLLALLCHIKHMEVSWKPCPFQVQTSLIMWIREGLKDDTLNILCEITTRASDKWFHDENQGHCDKCNVI